MFSVSRVPTLASCVRLPTRPDLCADTDGEWSYPSDHWKTKPFLAWLFNESPVKDTIAINDRWGNDCRGKHGGFYVCEYGGEVSGSCIGSNPTHPWTSHEGMGKSFGYNRIDEYKCAPFSPATLAIWSCASNTVLVQGPAVLRRPPGAVGRIRRASPAQRRSDRRRPRPPPAGGYPPGDGEVARRER